MIEQDDYCLGVVLRIGELFLKGKNRWMFEEALAQNVKQAVRHRGDVRVESKHGRIFVRGSDDAELLSCLHEVFGVSSISRARFCQKDLDVITAHALELAKTRPLNARTFRISARRSDKRFHATSTEIGRIVGAAVASTTGLSVDLEDYDFAIGIEIGPDWAFLYADQSLGAGGLPVGTSGEALLLLSGGIDSPVAGHLMQKRGLRLEAVYFHSFPYTGDGAKDKVQRLGALLARRQTSLKLHIAPFTGVQEQLRDQAPPKLLVLLYRRAMIRIAEALADKEHINALITGESLGQVASQTLQNLGIIEDAARKTILRPLIGFDKSETIALARKIGSYDISILPHGDCCSLFVPKHPETKASIKRVREAERTVDCGAALERAIADTECIILQKP